jgi:hypothetical protein
MLFKACPEVQVIVPHLRNRAAMAGDASPQNDMSLQSGSRKIRVGFLSKFFTMEHAHGELLKVVSTHTVLFPWLFVLIANALCFVCQGIIRGLDRRYFTVVVIPIANPQEYLNPDIISVADEVHHLSLVVSEGQRVRRCRLSVSQCLIGRYSHIVSRF